MGRPIDFADRIIRSQTLLISSRFQLLS